MAATHIQCGITNHRINREPLDAESVYSSYEGMIENIKAGFKGGTIKGAFYPGLVTAVTDDEDTSYNGLWMISKKRTDEGEEFAYSAEKMATKEDVDNISYMTFLWGHL